MRIIFLFILFSVIFSSSGFSLTLVENNYRQIKAVQIFNLDSQYENNLSEYFRKLKNSGINTVFFRVFQNYGDRFHLGVQSYCQSGVYFKSQNACVIRDLLSKVVKYAGMHDLKVYAWMSTRSLSFLKNKYPLEVAFKDGNFVEGYGVSIFNPDVRREITKLFKDLAYYDIDGILIQDDFILRYNEGFSKAAGHRFFVDTGHYPDPAKLFKDNRNNSFYNSWNKWKMQQLSAFLSELRFAVKLINPGIKFAVNIYYETPSQPDNGLSWYSQSIERYKDLGFSYYAYMAYHEQISRETGVSFYKTMEYINKSINSFLKYGLDEKQIIVKIQVRSFYNGRVKLPEKEINILCDLIDNYGKLSYALVPFERISDIPKFCFY
ncbi:poly-beta-1,6-N-acetyl-D-glucosamine N-deacetylase PgaB [Flexistipes sp.]|uniref:poly-beta-1,6-N-acetyl-D-glucosamine N-deacetylase PgaB n=1 Tax=Flexistipes sp. TaxID=3088135 RepID=UPI002E1D636C|nr:poly-beta-1,6-N-acetyl-D-glucosamine N-deacetylase PgaB [Flexistipes sp.]